MNEALQMAQDAENLTEIEGKDGLFRVDDLSPETLNAQTYFLDLRAGFAFYGYDEVGEPIQGEDKADPPKIVKEIEAHYNAEGTAKLEEFVGGASS